MAAINGSGASFELIVLSSSDEDEKGVKMKLETSHKEMFSSVALSVRSESFAPRKKVTKRDRTSLDEASKPCSTKDQMNSVVNNHLTVEDHVAYFIKELSPLMKDATELKIINRIQSLSTKCNSEFLNGCIFRNLVKTCVTNAHKDKKNIFLHIKDLYDTMKAYKKPKDPPHEPTSSTSTLLAVASATENGVASSDHKDCTQASDTEGQKATDRHIRKLEKLLLKIDRRIKKLQEAELTLDDLDNDESVYVLEDRYKKRFVKVWEKLCQLKGRSSNTGRHIEKKIHFEGTRYPEINKQIEKFVNKRRMFPDFCDICKIVDETSQLLGISLSPAELRKISEDAFEDVGKELKKRRQMDEKDLFGSFLTDKIEGTEDPAKTNPELKEELEKNDRIASTIEEVIAKYVQKENELRLKPEEGPNKDSDAPSSGEDEEEEEGKDAVESDTSRIESVLSSEDEESEVVRSEVTSLSSGDEDLKYSITLRQSEQFGSEASTSSYVVLESVITLEETNPAKKIRLDFDERDCDDTPESSQDVITLD